MTIHAGHPFLDPDPDPVRRFRGRLAGRVTLWTAGEGPGRAGLTVSSVMVAGGEPPHVLGLLDPDSDLAETLEETGRFVVHLLQWAHRDLADAFAGVAPAPGGPFTLGTWRQTEHGPVLEGVAAWLAADLRPGTHDVGWSRLVDGVVDHAWVGEDDDPLVHRRGRYQRLVSP